MPINPTFLQRFTTAGITQSAVRLGKGGRGVVGMRSAAREFCAGIKLGKLPEPAAYAEKLNDWTSQLKQAFPKGGRRWGVARKCLNIFMRDASYNVHLAEMYPGLKPLERVLEVPLDGYTAAGLLREEEAAELELRWDAIIRLTPDENQEFQQLAQAVADRKGVCRIHLDLDYFPFP
jgi:hypothetical protein